MFEYMISSGSGTIWLKKVKMHGKRKRMLRKGNNSAFFNLLASLRATGRGLHTAGLYLMVLSLVVM